MNLSINMYFLNSIYLYYFCSLGTKIWYKQSFSKYSRIFMQYIYIYIYCIKIQKGRISSFQKLSFSSTHYSWQRASVLETLLTLGNVSSSLWTYKKRKPIRFSLDVSFSSTHYSWQRASFDSSVLRKICSLQTDRIN